MTCPKFSIMLRDARIQIGIGIAAFIVALIDQIHTGATNLREMSVTGKVAVVIICVILLWFVVRYLVIGLFFNARKK